MKRDPETQAALTERFDVKARQRFDAEPQTPSAFTPLGDLTEPCGKGVQTPDGETEECA